MKFGKIIFLLFFLCQGNFIFSQPDSILALKEEKQVLALLKWYYDDLIKKDSQQVTSALTAAEKLFADRDNKLMQRQAWLLQQYYKAGRNASTEQAAALMLDAANIAGKKNWPITEAECWHYAGGFYFSEAMYVPAFEYMQKAQNVFDEYEYGRYTYLLRYADGLAGCYYRFGEYGEAIKYMKKTKLFCIRPVKNEISSGPGSPSTTCCATASASLAFSLRSVLAK